MASISATLSLSSTSSLVYTKPRGLYPTNELGQNRVLGRQICTSTIYGRKLAQSGVAMTTGDAPTEAVTTETPEIVKAAQEAWEKLDDKYAVTSLAVAAVVALWCSTGLLSAIDRLPLLPGVLELVGIVYSGWFAYNNLVFTPDREALLKKIDATYKDIIGSS